MSIKIDHVVIAGDELARLVAGFTAIGLTPDAGGVHAGGQTHNALIGFNDGSYLELIAPVPGGTAETHYWGDFMRTNAGVCAWAIRSEDIQADAAYFRSKGVMVGDPTRGGRTRPDGVQLEWITARLDVAESSVGMPNNPLGSLLPFLIQDVTPRELRVPRTASAIGTDGISGVSEVLIDVPALPEAMRAVFERDLGVPLGLQYNEPVEQANFDSVHSGLYGVLLGIKDSAAAQSRYGWPDSVHSVWRDQATFWPKIDQVLIGVVGEMV